jgi:hypothetical protein
LHFLRTKITVRWKKLTTLIYMLMF